MESKQVVGWFGVCLLCLLVVKEIDAFEIVRRSAAPERDSDDYPDYQSAVRYDEYPSSHQRDVTLQATPSWDEYIDTMYHLPVSQFPLKLARG
ncbi:hypothetical protein FQR65_LT06404 [Abscondita terminalis]|nr:hypothetical protein FQR65_LT06404 [Abscondita terminalis]